MLEKTCNSARENATCGRKTQEDIRGFSNEKKKKKLKGQAKTLLKIYKNAK